MVYFCLAAPRTPTLTSYTLLSYELESFELTIVNMWKYTCQPPRNGVAVLGICKYPYFNPTYDYVASFSKVLGGGFECLPLSELLEFVSHQIKG